VVVEGVGWRARIGESALTFSGSALAGLITSEELGFSLGDVQVRGGEAADAFSFALRGASVTQTGERAADSGLRSFGASLGFDELELRDQRYAPGRLEMALRNIDGEAWQGLRQAMAELEAKALAEQELARARVILFTQQMPEVLGSSPEIAVEQLQLVGPAGTLEASARIGVDGSDPVALGNPFMLLAKIQAEARMSVPTAMLHALVDRYLESTVASEAGPVSAEEIAAMAKQTRVAMLAKLLSDNTLVQEGDVYRLRARLEEGLLIVNGRPADPSFLMGIVPGF
jgi:uncharacterized protein YdgA (DUF945 family)